VLVLGAGTIVSLINQDVDVILDPLQVKEKGVFTWPLVPFEVLPFSVATAFSTNANKTLIIICNLSWQVLFTPVALKFGSVDPQRCIILDDAQHVVLI
jgi:hypothetical protein